MGGGRCAVRQGNPTIWARNGLSRIGPTSGQGFLPFWEGAGAGGPMKGEVDRWLAGEGQVRQVVGVYFFFLFSFFF